MRAIQLVDKQKDIVDVLDGQVLSKHERSLGRLLGSIYYAPMQAELMEMRSPKFISQEEQFTQQAQRHELALPHLAYMPTFSANRVIEGEHTDWVLMNLKDDPLFQAAGNRLIAPKAVERKLQAIQKAGLDIPALFIGHEVQKGVLTQDNNELLKQIAPPVSHTQEQRLQMLNIGSNSFWRGVGIASVAALAGIGLAAGAVVGAGALTVGMAAGLDPVLFALLIDPETSSNGEYLAAWHYIAHWHWDE